MRNKNARAQKKVNKARAFATADLNKNNNNKTAIFCQETLEPILDESKIGSVNPIS
jgi:hypothetical protein